MSDQVNKVLTSPTKEVVSARGELSVLWRRILQHLNITPIVWHRLMQNFLNNPNNGISRADSKRRSSMRGNMNKALFKSNMTWRNFIIGIRLLSPVSVTFEVRLNWANKKSATVVQHTVEIKDLSDEDLTMDLKDGDTDD